MQVLITHDFYETFGGAERVTAEIAAAFPDAPVFAILGRRSVAARMGIEDRVHPILPELDPLLGHYRWLAPAYLPLVMSRRLPPADVVVASSYAYAHAFRSAQPAPVVCYCHGPFRHLWSQEDAYASRLPGGTPARTAFQAYTGLARAVDRLAASSVRTFLTQSPFTAELIERAYGRRAEILPPPVDCELFRPSGAGTGGYHLFVGRLVEAYKRPSLVVEAFARMPDKRLLIAGDGPARRELQHRASGNVEFLGALDDAELVAVMQGCEAAIFPSVDDFGLVPLEVNACGRPVLALRGGGALYTLAPGISGEFIAEQTVQAVIDAVQSFDPAGYDPSAIRQHALRWSVPSFRREISSVAERVAEQGPRRTRRGGTLGHMRASLRRS